MARTKKAVAAAEAEVKEVKTAAVEAEVTETPAKKTRAKKTTVASKKATPKAEEKAPEAVEAVAEAKAVEAPKAEVFIEFGGVQVAVDEIVKNAKLTVGEDKDIKVYVKPDESKAYIVAGEETVAMDVFFCE